MPKRKQTHQISSTPKPKHNKMAKPSPKKMPKEASSLRIETKNIVESSGKYILYNSFIHSFYKYINKMSFVIIQRRLKL